MREHKLVDWAFTAASAFDFLICLRVAWELKDRVILNVFSLTILTTDAFRVWTISW